jgi:predicted Zn finger-like uncharacterized protein
MVVQCSSCLTEFELDPAKVPANGVRARCSVCSAVIVVPAPRITAPAADRVGGAATVPAFQPRQSEPVEPPREPARAAAPAEVESPAAPPRTESEHVEPSPFAPARVDVYQPPATVAASVAASAARVPEKEARPTWSAPAAPPPPAAASAASHAEPEGQRRSINPFLTRDPALRAKRLARALVSDIVAYHPARHAEGLRDGTLKTLFRDEIKKSYEEYVDQVGRDFAGSTTHFQDALNDVLASGKKLF